MSVLGGALNFGGLGAGGSLISASGLPGAGGLGAAYNASYQGALGLNQQLYNNILGGYQNLATQQRGLQGQIQQGYGNVLGGIQNTLGANYGTPGQFGQWGIAAPAAQAITNLGQQQNAQILQNQQSRGLGNNTITGNLQNQQNYQTQSALGSLGAQLGQTYAGYEANLGLAGLGYANTANQQNTALGQSQLGWENTVSAPYPQAGQYSNLLQQAGAYQQYLAQQQRLLRQPNITGFGGGGGAGAIGHTGLLSSAYEGGGGGGAQGPTFPSYGGGIAPTQSTAAQNYAGQVLNQSLNGAGGINSPQGQMALDQWLASQGGGAAGGGGSPGGNDQWWMTGDQGVEGIDF